jgi:serine/threonine protein kinase
MDHDAPMPGKIVGGKYQLVEIAGAGGMATVWRAIQQGPGRFARTVAIKQLHPHLAADELFRAMFFEEARVGALLDDPNLARVQDFFEETGHLYLVMEWVEGIDLATYIRYVVATAQETRWELITAVGIGLLRGLAAAHEHVTDTGESAIILHRDVSPHNVLISVKGPARLIDFGLALAADRMLAPTPPGTAKGKLAYLSPEVARGEPATAASDQFAAGSVLWEALAGRKLFDGADQAAVFRKLATADVAPIDGLRRDLPKKLTKIIGRALEADPAKRFASARAMALALGEVLKTAQSHVDLYQLLARTVVDARITLDMGRRTQAPAFTAAAPVEDSKVPILLPFVSAWRHIRSKLPFLGGDTPPRRQALGSGRTPTGPRRAEPGRTFHLDGGEEVRVGDLVVRCSALDFDRTPTEPVARLEVTRNDWIERVALDVPGQAAVAGHLVSMLACDGGRLSLRIDPIAAGRELLVFPHVTVAIDRFYIAVTGVDEHKVFLRLAHDGAAEHTIVGVSAKRRAVVERAGRRIGVERVAPPWVILRVDASDERPDELRRKG